MTEFYGTKEQNGWSVVYKQAIAPDGALLFPEKLTQEFLDQARKTMGSYLFANQYQNKVIPDEERRFKPEWNKRWDQLPQPCYRFAFVDPAIGQKDHSDYTAIVVVDVSTDGIWYVRTANRYRITPTQIADKLFELHADLNLQAIGIEVVAYQEALLYVLDEEMKRRQKILPIKDIRRSAISKETRIFGLVPRFEWGKIYLAGGLRDLEDELSLFPRAAHDDLLDALASLEEIVFYPQKVQTKLEKPHSPSDPNYEKWYIQHLSERAKHESYDGGYDNV